MKPLSAPALVLAFGGGTLTTSAYAALPSVPGKTSVIDANKNGKIEKTEFVAYMSKAFDKAAGGKGYCTYEEIQSAYQNVQDNFYIN
ncbi:MAG: hypothetical protein K0B16_04930 [Burkholderiaceae bacterium]|nr:hypothetical protein [Burkholderiaceae bacterium]